MDSTKPTLAFFGATGGCTAVVLAHALKAGYTCSALARTPSKLTNLLETAHTIPTALIASNLTIIQGDAKDVAACKRALSARGPIASTICVGIGGTPKLQASLTTPISLTDPHICENVMRSILGALGELRAEGVSTADGRKPLIVNISTTGVSDLKNDVPGPMYHFYHYALSVPHKDKKATEAMLFDAGDVRKAGPDAALCDFLIVRPTLLADGPAKGLQKVRVGWEIPPGSSAQGQGAPGPAVGYLVHRADVGGWIFENGVKNGGEWAGKCVSLTY
ncbi:hypothetical protein K402DRAFT_366245 [Aulographum hederae CBS 113979]|uniref:NAD(P)-binding domain-containing protein n=1 Tax=Aulographum hederae CBS 113979 TaxID=1176131 RepID=A0A6G1HGQ4_9PEZI|nr:hypothetical protein K402DRAFT_366245 [Aulographum hederae CBS 113979]